MGVSWVLTWSLVTLIESYALKLWLEAKFEREKRCCRAQYFYPTTSFLKKMKKRILIEKMLSGSIFLPDNTFFKNKDEG